MLEGNNIGNTSLGTQRSQSDTTNGRNKAAANSGPIISNASGAKLLGIGNRGRGRINHDHTMAMVFGMVLRCQPEHALFLMIRYAC